jgi:hypothetical protein
MPWSALPPHLNSPEKWKGTDWDNRWQRWLLKYKGWVAFGPRAAEWWARWREWPITLLTLRGKGQFRFEDDCAAWYAHSPGMAIVCWKPNGVYLSRCQRYCRWSVQLQWPLFFAVHWYPNKNLKGKPWFAYIGAHRDSDKVYWMPSVFLGRTWK